LALACHVLSAAVGGGPAGRPGYARGRLFRSEVRVQAPRIRGV